jgi:hypothetical protein
LSIVHIGHAALLGGVFNQGMGIVIELTVLYWNTLC